MRAASLSKLLTFLLSLGAVAAACALNTEGTNVGESPEQPSTTSGTPDGGPQPDASGGADAGEDAPAEECPGTCADPVPMGWQRVGFALNRDTPCADGLTEDNIIADAAIPSTACACEDCSITTAPTCEGKVQISYDGGNGQCGMNGVAIYPGDEGACKELNAQLLAHMKGTTFSPQGGACELKAVPNESAISVMQARLCTPSSTCEAALCAPGGGFRECIMTDGPGDCPQGPFTDKHIIGSGAEIACSACGCAVEATCNGTFTVFSNDECSDNAVDVPINNKCEKTVSGTPAKTFIYTTDMKASCNTTQASTPTLTLNDRRTLCCKDPAPAN